MQTAPWDSIETWSPVAAADPQDDVPFWDITMWARDVLRQAKERSPQPEHVFLFFGVADCPVCERLEAGLQALGERRFGRATLLRLKVLCGRKNQETTSILRMGDADFRLPGFPVSLWMTPHFLPHGEIQMAFHSLLLGPLAESPVISWAHLAEGRSIWTPPYEQRTMKVSIWGEVVRTLAVTNEFRQEFTIAL